ncbi:MAG: bifunctional phosphoribosylaminoimidazolecarboxamide formyltransferase/IMP cyclohydrolase [Planctomycetota bacterium]|nr:bifunctional phosphoribosylaminoimidazolecarboxamide formyltransferase/IMP cyclohydrolase [Planctomycetota bacterium]MDA1177868.1 bifunctional phosphoribosylaminoimidazolecarboxamide formyltransferase/IMP cyclohydrolase [Planctomycetota bacterium]
MASIVPLRRALMSVSNKEGLVEFATQLASWDVQIYSTGGTAHALREAGLAVQDIAPYTGFPAILDGRVKTLHPKIFGGILARRDRLDHLKTLEEHGILAWDLVVVNLYPFEATVAREGTTEAEAIEQIDVGGPSMIRAAAKNFAAVTVATSPGDYAPILAELTQHQGTTSTLRRHLAARAFQHTCQYDELIAGYFQRQLTATDLPSAQPDVADGPDETIFPRRLQLELTRYSPPLRYGENPHQRAAAYQFSTRDPQTTAVPGILAAKKLHGKELSYNNLLDLDSAWRIAGGLPDRSVSVIKHNNPCGAASSARLADAMQNALDGDPVSAFGSIIGTNSVFDEATAQILTAPGLFVEAIVAPEFEPRALEILTTQTKWKQNVRLLTAVHSTPMYRTDLEFRSIQGGMLIQESDESDDCIDDWRVVTTTSPERSDWEELRFAWRMVRAVKSNAIVVTRNRALCGVGAGQMSRVDSVEISLRKAGDRASGAFLASDAFFPFDDSIHHAARHGIRAIIQPGGSKRDDEVVQACNQHGMAMVFTGRRHFRH